jgi:hypothetical protein
MAAPLVGIIGAKALRKDLNRLTDDVRSPLYKAMAQAGFDAVQPVVSATKAALPTGPRTTGTLARTVRASRSRTGGAVRMGRTTVPYAGWVEFGGTRKQPHESHRQFIRTGRYLFPAARGDAERAAQAYSAALERLFASPGIWTNTTTSPGAVHD